MIVHRNKTSAGIRNLTVIALFAAVFAVCSWIEIPLGPVPFTLQTFAITLSVYVIGAGKTTASYLVYLFAGAVGVPVFSGFKGGIAVLLGVTGGYLIGFLIAIPTDGILLRLAKGKKVLSVLSTAAGLLICYIFGTAWLFCVYSVKGNGIGVLNALNLAVFPFLIPDAAKLIIANILGNKLKPFADRFLNR